VRTPTDLALAEMFPGVTFLPEEQWAELDDALITGDGVEFVDVLFEDGTWQSDLDAAARGRSAARAQRMANRPRHQALAVETQVDRRSR
jgi:hypothetical protein